MKIIIGNYEFFSQDFQPLELNDYELTLTLVISDEKDDKELRKIVKIHIIRIKCVFIIIDTCLYLLAVLECND